MTNEYQEARERIARVVGVCSKENWNKVPSKWQDAYLQRADQILHLKYSTGEDMIGVLSKDQTFTFPHDFNDERELVYIAKESEW